MPLRLRLALLFAAGAVVLIAGGGFLLTSVLSAGLTSSVAATLQTRAAALEQTLPDSSGPGHHDGAASRRARNERARDEESVSQVVTAAGAIRFPAGDGASKPLLTPSQLAAARRRPIQVRHTIPGEEPFLLLAQPLAGTKGSVLVVGASLDLVDQSVGRVVLALAVGGPVAVVLAGLGAWFLAGAALAPVERMRRQADEISERDTDASLVVPATRDEVAALARTLNQLLARLQGALGRQRGFVASAGHELRTPLAVLRAELELANREGRSRGELALAVASAAEETERLVRLAEDLLLLARSDESTPLERVAPHDLVPVAARSLDAFAERAVSAGVELSLRAPAPAVVALDESRARQIIDNLVDNAIRFAPAGTAVDVSVTCSGDQARLQVGDRGPGFPADFLPHAFERFRRPGSDRSRDHGGAGLGLSIVQALALAHHGRAEAANRPGGGAVVTVVLPLEERSPAGPSSPGPTAPQVGRRRRDAVRAHRRGPTL